MQRRTLLLATTAGICNPFTPPARAGAYPGGPIKVIYNFAPGGPGDAALRYLADAAAARLGQQVLVDNRSGGNGTIGILAAARAPADGSTLLFTTLSGIVQLPYLTGDKSFDPPTALQPLAAVGVAPLVILAHPSVPAGDFRSFVEWARAEKAPVQIAGAGAIIELTIARLMQDTGMRLEFIPYRGSAPAAQAVVAGEVKFYLMPPSGMTNEMVKAGRLKAIAVSSAAASALAPGVSPIAATVPGFVQEVLYGLWAPAGTPPEVVTRLGPVLREVLATPGATEKLFSFGIDARFGSADEVARATRREADTIKRILATTPVKFGQ